MTTEEKRMKQERWRKQRLVGLGKNAWTWAVDNGFTVNEKITGSDMEMIAGGFHLAERVFIPKLTTKKLQRQKH